ncbi:tyrosine-type recombinase/integrase [Microbispora sp. NPDC049125]|uniref:tyrosine-type recombinase/integrase n=1 Tax=Microbispora sp. NPDC049125 TaxID=3154929 RepID=UPI0034671FA1
MSIIAVEPVSLKPRDFHRPLEERRALLAQGVAALPALPPVDFEDRYSVHRLTAIWLESRKSPATAAEYYRDLRMWLTWCSEHRLDPFEVRRADVDLYQADLKQASKERSVARRLSSVSSWYRYLLSNEACERNPVELVDRPTFDRDSSSTVSLSKDEAVAFLRAASEDRRSVRLRTAAALSLLLTDGLRAAEVITAEVKDLGHNRGHRTLKVTRKGGKRYECVLAPSVAFLIDAYLADRAARSGVRVEDLTGPLFITEPSGPHPGGKRTDRSALRKLIRRIARAAEVPSAARLSPHSLRHSFATLALDAGVSLREVQDAMGHIDPRTTRGYDRSRFSLDRHPAMRLVSFLGGVYADEEAS